MNSIKKFVKELVVPIIIAAVLALLINQFLIFKIYIPSGSMIPTINIADQLFVTRVYNTDNLNRGDIVVFYFEEKGEMLIKRLIGLPGDKIDIDESTGTVYINGDAYSEPYIVNKGGRGGSFQVPEGEFFFLGDNRAESYDSRLWKYPFINKKDIKGKAQIIVFPLNRFGFVH